MRSLFKYPLVPLPLALAEKNGTLKKTAKSVLLNKLEGGMVTIKELLSYYCLIIDGMAAVRQLKASGLMYKEFAEKLLKSVIKIIKNAKRIHVVFDVYLDNSIKDVERNRRSHGELLLNQILPTSQIKLWNLLLSSNSNRNKLMQFIANVWKSLSSLLRNTELHATYLQEVFRVTQSTTEKIHELTSNHQDADTRILLHARPASLSYKEIVVSTPDSDVSLIMFSMIPDMNIKLYMLTGTGSKRRIIDMNAVGDDIFDNQNQRNNSKNDLLKVLIGFHCFMACDTLSSFAVRAKLKLLKLFFTHSVYVDAFCSLGTEQHLNDDILEQLERFTIHMFGKQHINQWLMIHVLLSEKWEVFFGTTTTIFQCFPAVL